MVETEGAIKSLAPSVCKAVSAKSNTVCISAGNFLNVADAFNQSGHVHRAQLLIADA